MLDLIKFDIYLKGSVYNQGFEIFNIILIYAIIVSNMITVIITYFNIDIIITNANMIFKLIIIIKEIMIFTDIRIINIIIIFIIFCLVLSVLYTFSSLKSMSLISILPPLMKVVVIAMNIFAHWHHYGRYQCYYHFHRRSYHHPYHNY